MVESEFDTLLLESVDEELSLLSDSARRSVSFHLERTFHLRKDEIPSRLEAFTQDIESLFGGGSNWIIKKLFERAGLGGVKELHEIETFRFMQYAAKAKCLFRKRGSRYDS